MHLGRAKIFIISLPICLRDETEGENEVVHPKRKSEVIVLETSTIAAVLLSLALYAHQDHPRTIKRLPEQIIATTDSPRRKPAMAMALSRSLLSAQPLSPPGRAGRKASPTPATLYTTSIHAPTPSPD